MESMERTDSSRAAGSVAHVVLVLIAVGMWVALVRLGWAFWTSSLEWTYVAEQSRLGAPWYYRLAGVWGGMEGSLLLFTGVAAAFAAVAARSATVSARWAAVLTLVVLVAVNLVLASPFDQLAVPATAGFGLNPILEHPAMAVHPPLLYAGMAASGAAALVAVGGPRPYFAGRPWLLASLALLTAAMTVGAAWSYVEQGWGGYWAWDPVENTSLLVVLAALAAIHAAPRVPPRRAAAWCAAPWLLALFGTSLVRSGRMPSVHGFAEQLGIGWAIFALAVVTTAATVWAVRRPPRVDDDLAAPARRGDDPRRVTIVLLVPAVVIVALGTVWPLLADVVGEGDTAVRGEFYSRAVGPLALAGSVFLVARLAGADGRRRVRGWSTVAHAGALALLAGVAASTFDTVSRQAIATGDTQEVAGVDVRVDGISTGDGARTGTRSVVADLVVAGHRMAPRIVVYPDRGGRLAELAVRSGPLTDVQVLLESANDDGTVIVTVHRRHGMWLVWLGAATVSVATAATSHRRSRRRRRSRPPSAAQDRPDRSDLVADSSFVSPSMPSMP